MRRLAALLLGLIVPLSLLTPMATARTPAAIPWAPCPEDATAECGTLAVPVDWNNPGAGTLTLTVARRKATDPASRIGVLVLGAGGPGGSGVNLVLGSHRRFSPELARRFDMVGFDVRGTNRSNPVVCSTELMTQAPDPIMKSQADFDKWLAYNARLRADCRARTGPVFDHVDSLSTARDLDAFRAALGERQVSYWGGSYGSLLGQLYAETFPHRVRAATLDSTMDHSLGTRAFMDTETWGAQDGFNEFAAWCERDSSCLQHGKDLRAIWKDLLERADRGEIVDPSRPETPVSALEIINSAIGAFYDPRAWPELSQGIDQLSSGGTLRQDALSLASQEVSPNPSQIFCLDFRLPIRDFREWSSHLRRQARIAPDMRYSTMGLYSTTVCLGTPDPIPNPQHELKVRTRTPLLVANALHDPATVYPWALSTTRQLGRSGRLLTYEGWGHIVYGRGDCATGAIDAYLLTLKLPAPGARCPAVPPSETRSLQDLVAPEARVPGWFF
ncbi:alpha/beta hydrolase [Nonomuraea sp. NPDC050556]|uniref:alpha/beta hydrolase n=1 Tax=Nonomuraea sp. NPDC050556 TaxID=3364369 RepID=UPI00379BDD75